MEKSCFHYFCLVLGRLRRICAENSFCQKHQIRFNCWFWSPVYEALDQAWYVLALHWHVGLWHWLKRFRLLNVLPGTFLRLFRFCENRHLKILFGQVLSLGGKSSNVFLSALESKLILLLEYSDCYPRFVTSHHGGKSSDSIWTSRMVNASINSAPVLPVKGD